LIAWVPFNLLTDAILFRTAQPSLKASEEAFDKALKAKRDAAEANARKVESLRLEALALEEKRASEALRVREENEARRAQVLEERERRDEAIAKLRCVLYKRVSPIARFQHLIAWVPFN
jgi:hypothetical protein